MRAARRRECYPQPAWQRTQGNTSTRSDHTRNKGIRRSRAHRALTMFLQITTEFASVQSVSSSSQPIRLTVEDKLAALRRLDKSRPWNSLDVRLYCTVCKHEISGRQIEVVGGTNGLRALHLKCSTPGCFSTPADWTLPVKSDTMCEIDILFRDNGA